MTTTINILDAIAPAERLARLVEELANEYGRKPGSAAPTVTEVAAELTRDDLTAWLAVEAAANRQKRWAYRGVLSDLVDAMTEAQALDVLASLLNDDSPTPGVVLRATLKSHVADELRDRIVDKIFELEEQQENERGSYAGSVDDPVRADLIAIARGALQ